MPLGCLGAGSSEQHMQQYHTPRMASQEACQCRQMLLPTCWLRVVMCSSCLLPLLLNSGLLMLCTHHCLVSLLHLPRRLLCSPP